jgi:ribonucleoside-diphosphate reductase alpha chain
MESILSLAKTEGLLFKYGSGTGTNFSPIRSSKELLQGGGTASGPVSFMKGFDSFAGAIKSGGKTRRAAKMAILNVDHPDILDFIDSKKKEEKKAAALINSGFDAGFNVPGGAYDSVQFQNGNHSVRVTDEFMQAVIDDQTFETKAVRDGQPVAQMRAREVWRLMAESAWACGDPGVQFDTTINRFHTCKTSGPINASNPCSEYMFLDDSACNLASLNLMRFRADNGEFEIEAFRHAVAMTILAQEILVDFSSYPTEKIGKNSVLYRPLGLGYANLGALLMSEGLPYDSEEGRMLAGAITALMGGHAYATSAQIAKAKGAFSGYAQNKDDFLEVISMHRHLAESLDKEKLRSNLKPLVNAAYSSWVDAEKIGRQAGFRNAQVTVLAPTGTIGFMMDCDTTGIEPDIALVKYKKLVGGGVMKIINQTVPLALEVLGYELSERTDILAYIEKMGTIEGAPYLKEEHLAVFDCAFRAQNGVRTILPMAHVLMMAAAQPFLSGAISKTVNMPTESTVEDIENVYLEAWKLGVKAVAIYRDGCKLSQPLSTSNTTVVPTAVRRRLSSERTAITHKFSFGGHKGYVTVGLFEDGTPGELFCTMSKEGSTISGLMDAFATAISLSLQYGVPLKVLVEKFSHTRFEPSGFTGNPQVPIAKSITDYIFRWLACKFLPEDQQLPVLPNEPVSAVKDEFNQRMRSMQSDAPPCSNCGTITVRNGSCYRCYNCGSTSGCS